MKGMLQTHLCTIKLKYLNLSHNETTYINGESREVVLI